MVVKQPVNIDFNMGVDTKTDPYQIQPGNFLTLSNSVFDTIGRLTKRNGFGNIAAQPSLPLSLSTFKGDLISTGIAYIEKYESQTNKWTIGGTYQPLSLTTTGLIRNSLNQTQVDSAVYQNLVCTVYTQTNSYQSYGYYASVLDVNTGQTLMSPVALTSATPARVFVFNGCFVIVYGYSGSLYYSTISLTTYNNVSAPVLISNSLTITSAGTGASYIVTAPFDGVVANNNLYLAWNGASSSGVKMVYINSSFMLSSIINPYTSSVAGSFSVTASLTGQIWVAFTGSSNGYYLVESATLTSVLAPTVLTSGVGFANIVAYPETTNCIFMYEQSDNPSFDTSIPCSKISTVTATSAGSVGSATVLFEQAGLASKAFTLYGNLCFLAAFQSPYQSSYFILTSTGTVLARLAYQNGGGYVQPGGVLSSPSPNASSGVYLAYLYKDLIEAVNKGTNISGTAANPNSPGGVYTQTGINIANFSIPTTALSIEAGSNLNISGGAVWGYDGTYTTENNFFIWPELIYNIDGTYHGESDFTTPVTQTCTTGGGIVTLSVTSTVGIVVGQLVTGTGIQTSPPTYVSLVGPGQNTVTLSQPMTGSPGSGRTVKFTGNLLHATTYYYVFTYEWTDNQGNAFKSAPSIPLKVIPAADSSTVQIYVPGLPFTYKYINSVNPVKIVGYRWSSTQQEYFQFTSIQAPTISTTSPAILISDAATDAFIVGNPILYTTGGVVEDIAPPATDLMALFDTRVWLVDSEDRNLLWFSKQLIEATPLEFSDLFTYYVPPIVGAQGSAGPITAIFPMDDKLIIFRSNTIQYINGAGPDNTGSNNQYSQPIFISSPVGCANQSSIVMMPKGLMFQSDNGIWMLDHSLGVTYIGAPVQAYNSYPVTSAQTIPGTTQVRFTTNGGPILMYDYFVSQWGEFSTNTNTYLSSTLYQSKHTLMDSNGNVYQETPGTYLDGITPVAMSFTTAWIQTAGLRGYQRAYWFFYLGTYLSAHQIQTQLAYDYDPTIVQTDLITPTSTDYIEDQRIFLAKQKCKSFQIVFTELNTVGGAGLTLSGLNLIVAVKKGYAPISAAKSVG